ncbi:pentapeptide repeat-containing protein [Rhodococcus globerulus]|uniref:pentapeptide repeat-containing protein n=1 Tax=Rhodococcus globerulus TaxID=33008 RepID=UPI000AEFADEE|nr:pentapeptide repeat-containing protein [Rhodococcus globerulus]
MTILNSRSGRTRPRRGRIVAVFGGAVLAAVALVTTGSGVAAAATPAELLTAACSRYVAIPFSVNGIPRGSNCVGANLTGADLTGANLVYATMNGANLTDANLTDANLTDANLTDANLTGANLTGANLTRADLTGADLTGANLTGTSALPRNITVPATSADGGPATWTTPTMLAGLTFGTCTHTSGSAFPVGTTQVTCTIGNDNGHGSGTFTVTVRAYTEAPVFIAAGPVTVNGIAGTELTHTFTTTGSPAPTVAVTSGTLPAGLTLSSAGVLTGTPTTAGSFPVALTATNSVGSPATLTVTVDVAETPAFADTAPVTLSGTVDTELPRTFTATGTPTPQITVTDGALPQGLSLSPTGVLAGKPTTAGPINFTITADNGVGTPATLQVTGTITAATQTPAQIITGACGNYVANPTADNVTDCSGKNLAGTDLTGVNLTGANLTGTDLADANLTGANLTGVTLTGANLTGTLALPSDITIPATSADGAPVTWTTPTMPTGLTFGTCAPASGTVLPVGATTVTCTVTSVSGDVLTTGTGTFTVNVTATPVVDPPATGSLNSLNSIFGS